MSTITNTVSSNGVEILFSVQSSGGCKHPVLVSGIPPYYWRVVDSPCLSVFGDVLSQMSSCMSFSVDPYDVLVSGNKDKASVGKKLFTSLPYQAYVEKPFAVSGLAACLACEERPFVWSGKVGSWLSRMLKHPGAGWAPVYLGCLYLGSILVNRGVVKLGDPEWLFSLVSESLEKGPLDSPNSDYHKYIWGGYKVNVGGLDFAFPPACLLIGPFISNTTLQDSLRLLCIGLWDNYHRLKTLVSLEKWLSGKVDPNYCYNVFKYLISNAHYGPALFLYCIEHNNYIFNKMSGSVPWNKYHDAVLELGVNGMSQLLEYMLSFIPPKYFDWCTGLRAMLRFLVWSLSQSGDSKVAPLVALQQHFSDNGYCEVTRSDPFIFGNKAPEVIRYKIKTVQGMTDCINDCLTLMAKYNNIFFIIDMLSLIQGFYMPSHISNHIFTDLIKSVWPSVWLKILGGLSSGFPIYALAACVNRNVFPWPSGVTPDTDPVLDALCWTMCLPKQYGYVRSAVSRGLVQSVEDYYGGFFTHFSHRLGKYNRVVDLLHSFHKA